MYWEKSRPPRMKPMGHYEVVYEAVYDAVKGYAHYEADGEVEDVAAHYKLFELVYQARCLQGLCNII